MESHTEPDSVTQPDPSQTALICSLLNGSDSTSSLASSLAQLPEAKNLLSQILANTSTTQTNLQQVLSAVSMVTQQQQQRLPTLKPTNLSPAPQSQVATTPTQSLPTAGRKRGRPPSTDQDESLRKRRGGYSTGRGGGGAGEKQSKGLRHFSQLVCEKVREKGITSYNEVADELVRELDEQEQKSGGEMQIDQKNIRRRVYDALNVLMAMNIISKEKKEIRWIGLPTNSVQECEHIQTELVQYEERITRKKSELHELVVQILTLKNLMKRNRERTNSGEPPTPNSAIGLPFILVNTNKNTVIDCSISSDKSEYVFNFDNTFELHQDVDILKKMGLDCGLDSGDSTPESLELAKSLLPKMLEPVLDEMAEMSALVSSVPSQSPVHDDPAPSTPQPPSTASIVHTPSLLTDNGPSYSSSPVAPPLTVTSSAINNSSSPSKQQLVAALQHLHQISSSPSSPSLPSSSSSQSLPSNIVSPSGNSITLPGSSVTARPLPLSTISPKSSVIPVSPLLKAQVPSAPPPVTGSVMTPGRSPGTKVVTVQQLPGNTSVADIIASLQHNVSNLLKQQHQSSGVNSTTNSTLMSASPKTLSTLLNSLQQPLSTQQQESLQKTITHELSSPGAVNSETFLTSNPSTT